MKRFCVILASLLISMMTVFAGSGISVMKCAHTDAITSVYNDVSDDCNGTDNKCHNGSHSRQPKPCMQISVEQLAPSLTASSFHLDFLSCYYVTVSVAELLPDWQFIDQEVDSRYAVSNKIPLPPRLYLKRLCVLNI